MNAFLGILFRWLHIIPACLSIGGVFFMRIVLPVGLSVLPPEQQKPVFLKCRRVFKFVIHPSILLFLITGPYNAWKNWTAYHNAIPASHAFFGLHVLLAIAVFAISLVLLAGKEPPVMHKKWMTVNLALLMFVVAAASALKWSREHPRPPVSHTTGLVENSTAE
jgi:uncharacterized membrane protein